MAGELKVFFSPSLVRQLADDVARVHRPFPREAFVAQATRGLGKLELLDRARQIARALGDHLPPAYPDAIDVLLRTLGPVHATDELIGAGLDPFYYLPHTIFVAERGLEHFDLSLRAQHALTQRFTCEFSIRAYLAHDPERTLKTMVRWARDPSPHVRRLVSEGTRWRLPWGSRVKWLDANPDRVLALLELLKDDPATVVRRSVANSLNDLGKLDAARLNATAAAWLEGASDERRALIEHALRSAVKRGEPGALRLLGYGKQAAVAIDAARFTPTRVTIGGKVKVDFVVRSTARATQDVLVDLVVHFARPTGKTSRKVFKLTRAALPAKGTLALSKQVSLAVHTTRKPHPGAHAVEVLVNGAPHPIGRFEVRR